jgi:NitT/TauT family transport system permease protein
MKLFRQMFELRKDLSKDESLMISILGAIFLICFWQIVVTFGNISSTLFPSPISVFTAGIELYNQDSLISNLLYSLKLNTFGYAEAVFVSIPLGYLIGLFPVFREAMRKPLDTLRFLPLPAMTGLFIAWCGIEDNMKIQFLAFSILAYLLPVIIQRIQEVPEVYIQTVRTLSNKKWDVISTVFIPCGLDMIFDDIRVLVAISWTYIMVAELVNKTQGLGAMIYLSARQGRTDEVFALLAVIVIIGLIQDRLFSLLGKFLFPYKSEGGK